MFNIILDTITYLFLKVQVHHRPASSSNDKKLSTVAVESARSDISFLIFMNSFIIPIMMVIIVSYIIYIYKTNV